MRYGVWNMELWQSELVVDRLSAPPDHHVGQAWGASEPIANATIRPAPQPRRAVHNLLRPAPLLRGAVHNRHPAPLSRRDQPARASPQQSPCNDI